MTCPFCTPPRKVLDQNEFSYAVRDGSPVSPGHTLVVTRRHAVTLLDLPPEEYSACFALVRCVVDRLLEEFRPDGFNIGSNCGTSAGQTVMHAHIHVIPRFAGDSLTARGGRMGFPDLFP